LGLSVFALNLLKKEFEQEQAESAEVRKMGKTEKTILLCYPL